MDYVIEMWSIDKIHFADCTCGAWFFANFSKMVVINRANGHKKMHTDNGDKVEIV